MPSHCSPSRRRRSLRAAVFTTAVIGGVILPATSAFADESPSVAPSAPSAAPSVSAPDTTPESGATTPRPVPERTPSEVAAPRGGVAAGERPAGRTGEDVTTAVAGSAAGAALLAGAGIVMLRRRGAAHRND
ncbi:sortase-dependent protein [Streptomyces sp. NPDC046316]|uniref:sortase-dependent protein n=1 Tax=Streptomyces sp. NPDC046316 TaxID=3154494 RepID=UPI0033C11DF5